MDAQIVHTESFSNYDKLIFYTFEILPWWIVWSDVTINIKHKIGDNDKWLQYTFRFSYVQNYLNQSNFTRELFCHSSTINFKSPQLTLRIKAKCFSQNLLEKFKWASDFQLTNQMYVFNIYLKVNYMSSRFIRSYIDIE